MKLIYIFLAGLLLQPCRAAEPVVPVDAQPLVGNVTRLMEALDFLGAPLSVTVRDTLTKATRKADAEGLQQVLDEHALFIVELNPESRVKVRRGQAKTELQQGGYITVIIKVVNLSTVTKPLGI